MQMNLRPFELPPVDNQNSLMKGLNSGMDAYRQGMDAKAAGDIKRQQMSMERERLDLAIDEKEYQRRRQTIHDIGNAAVAADSERDPARRAALHQAILSRHPDAGSLPREYHDPMMGPRLLRAEAGKARDDLDEQFKRAQVQMMQSRAAAYRRSADTEAKQRWVIDTQRGVMIDRNSGEMRPIEGGAARDPLAGAGIDDDGRIVGGGTPAGSAPTPWQINQPMPSADAPVFQPPPMRLGAPREEMTVEDETPRRQRGVQVAQARAVNPDVMNDLQLSREIERQLGPPPRRRGGGPTIWKLDENGNPYTEDLTDRAVNDRRGKSSPAEMTPMEQARIRMYGPSGQIAPQVPGVVTTAKSGASDVYATREAQGQRAYDQATPEQQERLQRLRQDQRLWSSTLGPPRAGYYYNSEGREVAKSDRSYKGDKEAQATVLMNMQKIEGATDVLLGRRTGKVDQQGRPVREGGPWYPTRAVAGHLDIGEVGQAYSDLEQGALGIAYALSGKQVAVAEMKAFIRAYGPQPTDGADRISAKVQRLKQFYGTLLSASRGGESYEQAFARAVATMGVRNPDGSSASGTPPASPAAKPSGLENISTEELIKRLGSR